MLCGNSGFPFSPAQNRGRYHVEILFILPSARTSNRANPYAATILNKMCKYGDRLQKGKKSKNFPLSIRHQFCMTRHAASVRQVLPIDFPAGVNTMEISSYGSIFFAQEMDETSRISLNRDKNGEQEKGSTELFGGSDTVTISEEARKLSEKLLLEKQEEQRRQEQEDQQKADAQTTAARNAERNGAAGQSSAAASSGASGSGGGGGGSSSSSSSAENIKAQIQQVEARLQTIASSSQSESIKSSQMAMLQAQLAELQQQLNQAQLPELLHDSIYGKAGGL